MSANSFTKSLKRFAIAVPVSLVLASGAALPRVAAAETLADALVGAYEHSGLLEQNRALLRAADEDVAAAKSALKPVLRWAAGLTQSFGTTRSSSLLPAQSTESLKASISLIGELLLYDFGASAYRVEAAKETVLATRQALVNLEQQVLLRAVAAYMGVIEASETVELRNNNLRLLTQELRAARDRFDVGEVTRTDVALAEAQLANARSGLAGAEGVLLRAVEEYRNAVGHAPGNLSQPPSLPNVGGNLASAKALAVRAHPSIIAAQHQVAAADLSVEANEAAMAPRITLNGQYGLNETFDSEAYTRSGSVGVEVGQTIEVYLDTMSEHEGHLVLSKTRADQMKAWERIANAYRNNEQVKGGLSVDIGVKAFLPGSQVDLRPVKNLEKLLDQEFDFRIITILELISN